MATYALPADVAKELRGTTTVTAEEGVQWQAWLDRVERSIQRAFARAGLDLAQQVALGDPTADDVKDVEIAAVIRKIHNPAGFSSTTHSLDDGSVTTRRDYAADGDPLALTDADLEALLPDTASSAFSTRPGFDETDTGEPYWWGYEAGNYPGPWIG